MNTTRIDGPGIAMHLAGDFDGPNPLAYHHPTMGRVTFEIDHTAPPWRIRATTPNTAWPNHSASIADKDTDEVDDAYRRYCDNYMIQYREKQSSTPNPPPPDTQA